MKDLTLTEVADLPWVGKEKYCLYDRGTKSMFLTSDNKESLEDALKMMTPEHPVYPRLQLVERKDK